MRRIAPIVLLIVFCGAAHPAWSQTKSEAKPKPTAKSKSPAPKASSDKLTTKKPEAKPAKTTNWFELVLDVVVKTVGGAVEGAGQVVTDPVGAVEATGKMTGEVVEGTMKTAGAAIEATGKSVGQVPTFFGIPIE